MQFTVPGLNNKKIQFELREDRAILIICIGIALVFWLLVKLSQEYRATKEVILHFNIPGELTFTEAPPNDLKVQIEGAGWDLMYDFFSSSRVNLTYDLLQTDRLSLNRGQLRTDILNQLSSSDLTITELNYDNINLALEQKVAWRVPVVVASNLSFAEGFHLEKPVRLEPDSVEITGPVSMASQIDHWGAADSLILKNLKNSREITVRLSPPPRELTLSASAVKAIVSVEQFTEKFIFVPLTVRNAPDSVKVFPANIRVRCTVGLSQYNALDQDDFELVLDLKDVSVSERKNTAPIRLTRQPDFARALSFSPNAAEFYILK